MPDFLTTGQVAILQIEWHLTQKMVRTLRAGSFFRIVQISNCLASSMNIAERSAAHFCALARKSLTS